LRSEDGLDKNNKNINPDLRTQLKSNKPRNTNTKTKTTYLPCQPNTNATNTKHKPSKHQL